MNTETFNSYDIDNIKHLTNTEVIRRLLIKYFADKGFTESFDRQLYPSLVQDMPVVITPLINKIEIVPYVRNLDQAVNKAVIGWNMFVLGNQRMYLGETFHNNLQDLARQIRGGIIRPPMNAAANARHQTTPRRVITFITRVLGDHDDGYADLSQPTTPIRKPGDGYASRQTMLGMPQQYFTRSGY